MKKYIVLTVVFSLFCTAAWAFFQAASTPTTSMELIPKTGWKVIYADSEELVGRDGRAVNAIDNNVNTFWHTQYYGMNPGYPHEIQIDLGKACQIKGFRYFPRQDGGVNGTIKQYEFYVSADGVNWGSPAASGTFGSGMSAKTVSFTLTTGRFVRLRALSEVNGNPWVAMGELDLFTEVTADMVPDWTGIPNPPLHPLLLTKALSAKDVTDLQAKYIADPFLFYENGTWYMFFEIVPTTGPMNIGVAKSSDAIHWKYDRAVLREQFTQLSYPQVFKYGGHYYMIPETATPNEVRVYEASNFPYDWHLVSTIASGRYYVDPSVFRYAGKWWMFVGDNTNCYLFYSQSLTTGWIEHPMSPIIRQDRSKARPGGRSFVYGDGRIIRIVQKDDLSYGEQVRAFEVDRLNETQYSEHELNESPLLKASGDLGWNALGMHQFDPWWTGNQWIISADGMGPDGAWSIGIYRDTNSLPPEGVIDSPQADLSIKTGDWVQFAGTGSDADGNYPLSYLWNFGAGSGIADSTLEDPGSVQYNIPGTYTVSFKVTDSLGVSDPTPATRLITVTANSGLISKAGWRVIYADSEELVGRDGRAANAIDGNINTFWHTKYSGGNPGYPHEIQIDLGTVCQVNGFRYLPRQDGGVNGTIKQYEFYVSADGVNWGTSAASGTFGSGTSAKQVWFALKMGRFVRLRALSEVNGNPWASMAEIDLFGSLPPAPEGTIDSPFTDLSIKAGDRVQFAGTGSSADGNYPLSYLWNFGAGSGIADSTLEDPGSVQYNIPGTYTVSFKVTDSLGVSDPTPATRLITVTANSGLISKAGWRVIYADSEELVGRDGRAANAIDGNINTFWHTKYSGGNPGYPHEIQIDLGTVCQVNGFRYLPRQDGGVNGTIKQYEFYVSADGANWGASAAAGTFGSGTSAKEVWFAPKMGRFVHLRALSEVNGNPWASMAEIDLFGSLLPSPEGVIDSPSTDLSIKTGDWVQFTGTGSGTGGNYPLSYFWSFGAGSGIADSILEDPGSVQYNIPGTYTVSFKVTDSLGVSDLTPATRVITVTANSSLIPKAGWRVIYADSEELVGRDGRAANAIDSSLNTFWHTKYSGSSPGYPHEIQIDLGTAYQVNGFRYLPRQDGGVNGTIKQYEFYVSTDEVNWGASVAAGTFGSGTSAKDVWFAPKTGRFVRLRALSEVNGNPWTSMAEIDLMGALASGK